MLLSDNPNSLISLGISLAIGLLIGVERGWRSRQLAEGSRVAGLRTFGLTGLLGGCAGLLSDSFGASAFAVIFIGFSLAISVAFWTKRQESQDVSATSLVSMLLTLVLGALATSGKADMAVSATIVMALLLRYKELLHAWLKRLEEKELQAVLQLLLISLVLLPVLPNQGYGPWQVLNPYEIWLMVVLIAGISFVGYISIKLAGADKGILLTALTAGLASSTALTLTYSKLSQKQPLLQGALAVGILLACCTMFPRVLLVATVINPALFPHLLLPIATMMLVTLGFALAFWFKRHLTPQAAIEHLVNPLELKSAIGFGLLLTIILLIGRALTEYLGDQGVYLLAIVSGIADVDPVNLTLSRMSLEQIPLSSAVTGIILACSTNTLVKAGISVSIAGPGMLWRVFIPLLSAATLGLGIAYWQA
ncbi:MgtC/SapB family protein [Bowmanella denitrificans]|uniref:MgtC/SapB family protein n=1 Tax=Bowmanella denitrificans TaxID=366582 RepID=UPI000C9B2DD3|nr:DUF4010 domain-containing protein [Bowmanella denitrificans]